MALDIFADVRFSWEGRLRAVPFFCYVTKILFSLSIGLRRQILKIVLELELELPEDWLWNQRYAIPPSVSERHG